MPFERVFSRMYFWDRNWDCMKSIRESGSAIITGSLSYWGTGALRPTWDNAKGKGQEIRDKSLEFIGIRISIDDIWPCLKLIEIRKSEDSERMSESEAVFGDVYWDVIETILSHFESNKLEDCLENGISYFTKSQTQLKTWLRSFPWRGSMF